MEQLREEIGTKKDLVNYRLQTARSDLNSARILLEAGEYKDAIANFNKEYIKTEIFPRTIGRQIGEAEEIRHASDYDDFYIASKVESERQIAVSEELIRLIDEYCAMQFDVRTDL